MTTEKPTIEELDSLRKDDAFMAGEMTDLHRWLEDGYKDGSGKEYILKIIWEKREQFIKSADNLLKEIFKIKKP